MYHSAPVLVRDRDSRPLGQLSFLASFTLYANNMNKACR